MMNDIEQYSVKVQAVDNHGHKYDVVIYKRNFNRIAKLDNHDNFILRIENTPGSWYLSTLASFANQFKSNELFLDAGQNWKIVNFKEVLQAAFLAYGRRFVLKNIAVMC